MDNNTSLNDEILKNTPPIGVSTLSVLGVPLSDMVYVMTIAYILAQIACTIYKTYVTPKKAE